MSRHRLFFQKKRKNKKDTIAKIRRKGYKNKYRLTHKDKIIYNQATVLRRISETLVEVSKSNIREDVAIHRIKEYMDNLFW